MINDIREINFPNYATLSSATVSLADMGDMTISTQVKIDGNQVPDFSYDWEIDFKGEKYIQPLREPQANKNNESLCQTIDLTFHHWAIYEMKRYYFVELASIESGTPIADKYIASLGLNLGDFCVAFQNVLDYYFNGKIVVDLNPTYEYPKDAVFVSISYSYIWDVLQSLHPNYGVRWQLRTNNDICYIKIGYPAQEVEHIFRYGYEGGLMKIERQVQDNNIRNRLLGRGGDKNLPAYYFKEAPEGSTFASDPDAIPELANIYFDNLRGKTFRDYVRGWKAKHYGGEPMEKPTEEYNKGYTDEKFNPIEYVDDTTSIEKYGLLVGALDNIDDVHPTIQEVVVEPYGRVDEVVAVETITSDDIEQSVEDNVVISNVDETSFTWYDVEVNGEVSTQIFGAHFVVPDGQVARLDGQIATKAQYASSTSRPSVDTSAVEIVSSDIRVLNTLNGTSISPTNIPAGAYYYIVDVRLRNISNKVLRSLIVSYTEVKLISRDEDTNAWKPTFDIWVKNIWNTRKYSGETNEQYVNRVWGAILGARGGDATINFGSGWLAVSDYDFIIAKDGIAYDTSKSLNGVNSEWRITLYKTDAEFEATGKYIPNATTNGNAKAGDYFYFTNIDLPHQYVLWAEEKVDERKRAEFANNNANPTWVVGFDKIRLHDKVDGMRLIDQIQVGSILHPTDFRFVQDVEFLSLYVTSITYTYNESLLPDIEVVLSSKELTTQSPISRIQSEIDGVYKQLGVLASSSSAEVAVSDIVRKVGSKMFLRKDGQEDESLTPTIFTNTVKGKNFVQGLVGGTGWGIYKDAQGNTILEVDKINARQEFNVNNFVVNNATVIAGEQVISSAYIECSKVLETSQGYQCFFEQHDGSVGNLFEVNDIAYAQIYDTSGVSAKYYKRLVIEVGENYITLSKLDRDGDDIPEASDVIIQFGNTTNANRQGIIVLSPYGEGAPYIRQYANVDGYSLEDKLVTQLSNNGNIFTGKTTIKPGSTGATNLTDLEVGGANMIRNSGFTGDYVSRELFSDEVLSPEDEMWSEALKYWDARNITVAVSDNSKSGFEVIFANGSLAQQLDHPLVVGANYVLSFYGIGIVNYTIGGIFGSCECGEEFTRVVIPIVGDVTATKLTLTSDDCILYDLKLERGTIATDWRTSPLDNNKELAEMQSMHYLQRAITEGNTEIEGGLVLTNIVKVGEHEEGNFKRETGGMSGYWSNDNDVAFWAGGDMRKAIRTAQLYKDDASYQPTQAEIAEMAKFVVTHGGRAILNDIVLRGYLYALGGEFVGMLRKRKLVITNDNFRQYFYKKTYVSHTVYTCDIEKTGTFVVLDSNLSSSNWADSNGLEIHLPNSIEANNEAELDYARSFVGNQFVLYNLTSYELNICDGSCTLVESNHALQGTCTISFDDIIGEQITWNKTEGEIKII